MYHGCLQWQGLQYGELVNPNLEEKINCWCSFLSWTQIIFGQLLVLNKCDTKSKPCQCPELNQPIPGNSKTRPGWKSTIQPTETFQKWSAYHTQAIFSRALICEQSWLQSMNNAIGGGLAPLLPCAPYNTTTSAKHNFDGKMAPVTSLLPIPACW